MKITTNILFFTIIQVSLYAQRPHSLTGTVIDENGDSLQYGEVLLRIDQDSSIYKIAPIYKGTFDFDLLYSGIYSLELSCIGIRKQVKQIRLDTDLVVAFIAEEDAVSLEEITISAHRETFKVENENVTIDLRGSILKSLPSMVDILSKLPRIQIDPNGESISIIGKGSPLIFIENQRISLAQLNNIPVEEIETIEIINNPSSKYDAEGQAVILVRTKKKRNDGYDISLSSIVSFQRNLNNYNNLTVNLKRAKLELRSNFSFNNLEPWESLGSAYAVPRTDYNAEFLAVSDGDRPQFIIGMGGQYRINQENNLSININVRSHTSDAPIRTNSQVIHDSLVENSFTLAEQNELRRFLTANFNYTYSGDIGDGFIGFQYTDYTRNLDSDIQNDVNEMGLINAESRQQKFNIGAWTLRANYEKQFSSLVKWEVGGLVARALSDAFLDIDYFGLQQDLATIYDYEENNLAGFTNINGSLKDLSYNAGIRIENTAVLSGFRRNNLPSVDRNNTFLFPSISLSLPISNDVSWTANYRKSISRPNYLNANSLRTFISPFLEFRGNINLKPTITQNLSVDISFKNHLLSASINRIEDPVLFGVIRNEEENIIMSPENFTQSNGYTIGVTSPLSYRKWSSLNTLTMIYNKVNDDEAILGESRPYLYFYTNHTLTLPHEMRFNLNFWVMSKRYEGIYERNSLAITNLSFSKDLSPALTFTFNFNDVFRQMTYIEKLTINNLETQNRFIADGRQLVFTLRYAFGKTFKSAFANEDVDQELNRIR